MQFCKIFIGDSGYKIFFKEKYTVFCFVCLFLLIRLVVISWKAI